MNNILTKILCLTILFFATYASASYMEMKNNIDSYEPPVYIQNIIKNIHKKTNPVIEKNQNFTNQQLQIKKIKANWEQLLNSKQNTSSFIQANDRELEQLKNAGSDEKSALNKLKKKFSLKTLEILTILRNPGIKAAKHKVSGELESFTQISNLDEILRQYSVFTKSLMNGVGPMKGKDSVKMKFPFPGVTSLKGQIVNESVKAAVQELEIAKREAVASARKTFWNLLYIHKARKITAQTLELFNRLESVANTRYKAGKTSFQDIIKLSIKTKILENNLITLKEKQHNLEARIFELLALPPDSRAGIPININYNNKLPSLKKLYSLAGENRQELKQIKAMIAKMENMVQMAETMILPKFTLNLSLYENNLVMQTGSSAMEPAFPLTTKASMGMGLPKNSWFGTNNAWLNQTRESLKSLKNNLKKAELSTNNMVRNAWFDMDKAKREAVLFQNTITDLSKSALDVSTRGYESGTVSFADVISSYTNWLDVNLSLARKYSDIGIAKAELERVVGLSLFIQK